MSSGKVLVRRRVSIHAVTYVLLLSLSLSLLGGLGLHFSRSVSSSLEQLRQETLPAGSVMRLIMREAGRMRRTVDFVEAIRTPEEMVSIREKVNDFRVKNDENLKRLHSLVKGEDLGQLLELVTERRRLFLLDLESLLQLAESDATGPEVTKAKLQMNLSYEMYRNQQDKLAEYCEVRASDLSGSIQAKAERFESFGIILALWPVLAGVGLFVYGFLTTALVFFRGQRES